MRLLLLTLLLGVIVVVYCKATHKFISDENYVRQLNERPNKTWTARPNFPGRTREDISKLLGFVRNESVRALWKDLIKERNPPRNVNYPASFDARTQWPGCVHHVRDQGQCGSCWAFGAAESVEDRFCVFSNDSLNDTLSVQEIVSCDVFGLEACNGGEPITALSYVSEYGIPRDSCFPYQSGNGDVPDCASECEDGEDWKLFFTYESTLRWHITVDGIQAALMDGPVEACFDVYDDFMNYESGVYVYDGSSDLAGGHCVEMIGWGHDKVSNLDYWICKNSWSSSWGGLGGFFLIEKGVNMCSIESEVFSITPDTQ